MDQNKLRTLSLRFTEGPNLPSSLVSGPSAFPRIRLEHFQNVINEQPQISNYPFPPSERWKSLRHQIIQSIKKTETAQNYLLQTAQTNYGCESYKAFVSELSQIRQTVQSLVKQLENEKNRIAKMKEKKRRKLIKARCLASQCYVEHRRSIRELERVDMTNMTNDFGVQLLLHPARESPSIKNFALDKEVLLKSDQAAEPIRLLLLEAETQNKRNSAAARVNDDDIHHINQEKEIHRLINTIKSFRFPPSTNGNFSISEYAKLANLLFADENRISHQNDQTKFQHLQIQLDLKRHSAKAWSTYNSRLKRFRRLVDEQTSPHRFFPILRNDQQIRLLNLLGKGGFAEVWEVRQKGLHMDTWEVRAVKITELHRNATAEEGELILSSTCKEVSLQRKLKHPNVVEMQECFEINPFIFITSLDLCSGGSLDSCIQNYGPIPEELAKLWTFQILKALEYLHVECRIVHFDIKPLNILLNHSNIKIADFGLHQPISSTDGTAKLDMSNQANLVGTVWYLPPEHLRAVLIHGTSIFDGRLDLWSVGIVLYEMLFQKRPFGQSQSLYGLGPDHLAALIYRDFITNQLQFFDDLHLISHECKAFIRRLLQQESKRPNATEALADTYLESLNRHYS